MKITKIYCNKCNDEIIEDENAAEFFWEFGGSMVVSEFKAKGKTPSVRNTRVTVKVEGEGSLDFCKPCLIKLLQE